MNMYLEGIYAPIPTPFEKDGSEEIAWGEYRGNLEKWKKSPLAGLVVCGSNGELPFLDSGERASLTKMAREVMGEGNDRKKVVTGTHCASAKHTVECSKMAADAGADATLLLPPHYFKGQGMPAVIAYFEKVADMSPIPVVLYNMPGNTGVNMDVATILHLADHPNIIAIKDTAGDMTQLAYLTMRTASDFSVFCGSGNYLLPALTLGVAGGTLAVSNIYPGACVKLLDMYRANRMDETRDLQRRIMKVSDAVTRKWGVPALKVAMDARGFYGGPCRLPLLPLDDAVSQKVRGILDEADLDQYEDWNK